MPLSIGVPREVFPGEKRVATVPEVVEKLIKLGFRVAVRDGRGRRGATSATTRTAPRAREIVADARAALGDVRHRLQGARTDARTKSALLREGRHAGRASSGRRRTRSCCRRSRRRKATVLAMDSVPRISRAQKMDALSSMANIAGYRAVIEAAHALRPLLHRPDHGRRARCRRRKVFVIGAGVAGLAAIGAASGLGAIVRANDTRPEVARPGRESLGGEFVDGRLRGGGRGRRRLRQGDERGLPEGRSATMFAKQAKDVDIIITTALIPGKPAPKLITAGHGAVDEARAASSSTWRPSRAATAS